MLRTLKQQKITNERNQDSLQRIEFELRDLKLQKTNKNKLYHKIESQKVIRDKIKEQVRTIRSQPSFLGEPAVERVRGMLDQKEKLAAHLQKRKDASEDMLKYLNEKLMRKAKLRGVDNLFEEEVEEHSSGRGESVDMQSMNASQAAFYEVVN